MSNFLAKNARGQMIGLDDPETQAPLLAFIANRASLLKLYGVCLKEGWPEIQRQVTRTERIQSTKGFPVGEKRGLDNPWYRAWVGTDGDSAVSIDVQPVFSNRPVSPDGSPAFVRVMQAQGYGLMPGLHFTTREGEVTLLNSYWLPADLSIDFMGIAPEPVDNQPPN